MFVFISIYVETGNSSLKLFPNTLNFIIQLFPMYHSIFWSIWICLKCGRELLVDSHFLCRRSLIAASARSSKASKSAGVSVCGDGRDRSRAHAWCSEKKPRIASLSSHARTSTPSLARRGINIHISLGFLISGKAAVYQSLTEERTWSPLVTSPPPTATSLRQAVIKMTANTKRTSHLVCKYRAL